MRRKKEAKGMELLACKCLRCTYTWTPNKGIPPKVCPRCKSYSWDQGYKRKINK